VDMKRDSEKVFHLNHGEPLDPAAEAQSITRACDFLRQAKFTNFVLLSNASNYTFLATLVKDKTEVKAIYKPRRGEIPLWDFPDGTLYKREYAAFVLSQELRWYLIPPTVIRDGPHGIGSVQWFVDAKSGTRYFSKIKDAGALKKVALFDYLVNNADRKLGHFIEGQDGRLWLVDHGLTFNVDPKLRTVLWDFSGEPVPDELLADLRALEEKLGREKQLRDDLLRLIDGSELEALESRIDSVIAQPVFAHPTSRRSVPWPWY
jgi:uncharacterized repeat protein (TIGR03843 family)